MAENDFKNLVEPDNYETKCLCVLVLDVSGSMNGEPINELNEGLKTFKKTVGADPNAKRRLEVSVITFESSVKTEMESTLFEKIEEFPILNVGGSTKLVDGVNEAIKKVKERKTYYKKSGQKYYRPWIVLMTDGEPDSDQNVTALAEEVKTGEEEKHFIFFAVGVQNANMKTLETLCNNYPPAKLKGLNFKDFFLWLSVSFSTITSSRPDEKVNLPEPIWAKEYKV